MINEAYEHLSNKNSRQQYDHHLLEQRAVNTARIQALVAASNSNVHVHHFVLIGALVLSILLWLGVGLSKSYLVPKSLEDAKAHFITPVKLAHSEINDISIRNFQTQFTGDHAHVFFTLNTNGKTTKYPTILISWSGSKKDSVELWNTEYPHPEGDFVKPVDVDFLIRRPKEANGVAITIYYSS